MSKKALHLCLSWLSARRFAAAILSLLCLLILSVSVAVLTERAHKEQVRQTIEGQANILANSLTAALSFGDVSVILQNTDALRGSKDIRAAGVYGQDGKLIAVYGNDALPGQIDQLQISQRGAPAVKVPVRESEAHLGTVYIQAKEEPLSAQVARFTGTALLLVIAVFTLTVMAVDSRELEKRNSRLLKEMAERERIEGALRQAQKMEAVGQLTGGVAHDFNNMLAVVSGSLELLDRTTAPDQSKAKRLIASALEASRRAGTLTQRLLAFSRQQPLKPEVLNPNKLVAGMSDLFQHSLGTHIQLETVLAGGIWRISADPNQLENVLLNLAVNARDAMPGGGRLAIATQNVELDDRYSAEDPNVLPGPYVRIEMTDTGSGMPPEVIAKAFDPFFTTKEVGKGTGLGLSQVYGFVSQSGGHVKIHSEVGKGTTFKVYLPRHIGEKEEEPEEQDVREITIADNGQLVLVVDDEQLVRQFSVEALTQLGYRVIEASGAKAALTALEATPGVDLLFTDIVMPEMDGRKLVDMVKQRWPHLPVIYTTGYTRDAVLDTGVNLLVKPFTVIDLAARVSEALKNSTAHPVNDKYAR